MLSIMRREPPNGFQIYKVTLIGETPILMSSGEADRESELYREYVALSKARAKTYEQEQQLSHLEWQTRIYFDAELGPYIPGKNVKEMFRASATKQKLGESVKRSLVIPDYRIPLIYDGPRDLDGLWKAGYRYTTMVANGGASKGRVIRTRPCFDKWAIEFDVGFDTDEIDSDAFLRIVKRAEKYGLGDYRPEFGAFSSAAEFVREQRVDVTMNGTKARDPRLMLALKKHAERVAA